MIPTLYAAATLILPLVFAIVCHEVAHGAVARLFGDRTAQERGRLTLNPFVHVDPIGTLVVPGILALAHLPVFGWAKPVPVDARRMRNPRTDMMLVAAAGPASNLLLAALSAVALGFLVHGARLDDGVIDQALIASLPKGGFESFLFVSFVRFLVVNLFLALFNLLPIPPFDGSHILEGLLPRGLSQVYGSLRRGGMLLVILIIVVLPRIFPGFDPVDRLVGPPFDWLLDQYLALANLVAGQS